MIEYTREIGEMPQEILNLPDRFAEPLEATIVTRASKKVLAILHITPIKPCLSLSSPCKRRWKS